MTTPALQKSSKVLHQLSQAYPNSEVIQLTEAVEIEDEHHLSSVIPAGWWVLKQNNHILASAHE